jgi:hypothetical protein
MRTSTNLASAFARHKHDPVWPGRWEDRPWGQNGSGYRFEPQTLSVEELRAAANGGHQLFRRTLQLAIQNHARLSGLALIEIKKRLGHGAFGTWLDTDFAGSRETARVYMRIARNWDTITANGWELKTLDELRRLLARDRAQNEQSKHAEPPLQIKHDDEKREILLSLDLAVADDFDRWTAELMPKLGMSNTVDTVVAAVRFAHEAHHA